MVWAIAIAKIKPMNKASNRLISPLTLRILLINVMALLIPVFGLLYLGSYKEHLIKQEMEALKTHGEIFSGALGEGAVSVLNTGQYVLNIVPARHILRRLSQPTNVRARLFAPNGRLVADSKILNGQENTVMVEDLSMDDDNDQVILNLILSMIDLIESIFNKPHYSRYLDDNKVTILNYIEAKDALNGKISGYVRKDNQGRLILSVALPVQRYYRIFGSLMLSSSGDKIEIALREIRSNILYIFAIALIITILLSIYLANAITMPLLKLANAAEKVQYSIGRDDEEIPDFSNRGDELGELSAALRNMTAALRKKLSAIERFAADVSHEIKNPLTSLRSAVETMQLVKDESQQQKLMHIIYDDVERLDRLISDISDASRLDAELSRVNSNGIDLGDLLKTIANIHNATAIEQKKSMIELIICGNTENYNAIYMVSGNADRLVQVYRNLISNAVSFSPVDRNIKITIGKLDNFIETTVEDEGVGIPDNKLDTIFDRFYTERPTGEAFGQHSGLGLSISKQIIEAHNGIIKAENRKNNDGKIIGTKFIIKLSAI